MLPALLLLLGCQPHDVDDDGFVDIRWGGDDCDDSDPGVNPDAEEICDDGIDQDCDGGAGDCALAGTLPLAGADAVLTGSAADQAAGWAVAGAGDLDRDGFDDVAIGAPRDGMGGALAGAVFVVRGPITADRDLASAEAKVWGDAAGDALGQSVACAGDVDGDHLADLVIGAWGVDSDDDSEQGAAYLVHGPVSGGAISQVADAVFRGAAGGDVAGWSVAGAGDVDHDGWDDVLVGAPYRTTEGGTGVVYLLSGPLSAEVGPETATATMEAEGAGHYAGIAVAGAGDTDGDGLDDFLVGAYWHDEVAAYAGAVYLLSGPVSGRRSLSDATARLLGEGGGDLLGWSVCGAGDVDADGHDDVLAGAYAADGRQGDVPRVDLGAVYLLLGPISGTLRTDDANAVVVGGSQYDLAGVALAGDLHVDGDRFADVLIGVSGADVGGMESAGGAALFYGPLSGTRSVARADVWMDGDEAGAGAGQAVGNAGDVDGNGLDDLLVGAWARTGESFSGAGAAWLVLARGY